VSFDQRQQLSVVSRASRLSSAADAVQRQSRPGGIVVPVVGRAPRVAAAVAATGAILALLVPAALASPAPVRAGAAASCANERVVQGSGEEVFFAFTLKGGMSCSKAHALMKSYQHRATTGRGCSGRGTQCGYQIDRVWWCSLPGYAGAPADAGCCPSGGRGSGCTRRSPSFTVRETSPPADRRALLHLGLFESPDGGVSCDAVPFGAGYLGCSMTTRNEDAFPAAIMEGPDHIKLCTSPGEGSANEGNFTGCSGVRLYHKVVLAYGQETELRGIRCASAPQGITCTFTSGAAAGKGFRLNSAEVVPVG
jgi:hypothetical protein